MIYNNILYIKSTAHVNHVYKALKKTLILLEVATNHATTWFLRVSLNIFIFDFEEITLK